MTEPYPNAKSKNEIPFHPLIQKSFVFLRSLGMRSAPEILILEIFREFFYEKPRERKYKGIDPDEKENNEYRYSDKVRAVLYSVRGRQRQGGKKSQRGHYFLPAYPSLAENSWFRKEEAPIIATFLLEGPIANYIWLNGKKDEEKKKDRAEFVKKFYQALIGNNSITGNDPSPEKKDILSVALLEFSPENILSENKVKEKIEERTRENDYLLDHVKKDELSEIIFYDLMELIDLEKEIPRMQWLELLMTFLRFSMPMWAMAQMKISNLLHGWLIEAIENREIVKQEDIEKQIRERNRGILHPSKTPTREIYELIESYIRDRIKINYILWDLEKIVGEEIKNKHLKINGMPTGRGLSIYKLLTLADAASSQLKSTKHYMDAKVDNYKDFLTRKSENFSLWLKPRRVGVGGNIQEFFNVLYHDSNADQLGGHLLESHRSGRSIVGFQVFPGQLLLKTITILAGRKKHNLPGGGGLLVLGDIERHFEKYGVDFGKANEARPALADRLKSMGLLSGSPDAGASVAVICPYLK